MTTKQALEELLRKLPEDRLRQVLDFARFLSFEDERQTWREFGRTQLSRLYGSDEPEYPEADLLLGSDP